MEDALTRAASAPALAGWRRAAAAFAAGLVMATGQAPLGWSLVALAGFAAIFAVADRADAPRQAALAGWAGGAGYFAGGMFWIVEPFLVDPVRHGWMAPFALVLLPAGLALFWAAAFWLGARIAQGGRRLLLTAVLLAVVEVARTFVLTGFPWALAGYLWIGAPPMQAAALFGPHGLTLLTTLLAAAGAVWLGRGRPWLAAPALAALTVAGLWAWGTTLLAAPAPDQRDQLTVRIVQPNAEQGLKWDPMLAEEFLGRLLVATAETPAGPPPDLIVWPETAVQYLLNGSDALIGAIDAAAGGRPVIFGIVRAEGPRYFNSLVVTDQDGGVAEVYDKHHLTPFGEYMPFGELLGRFGIHGLAASSGGAFTAGSGPRLIDTGAAGRALPLICYEAIFPHGLRTDERPDWIVQITNDAWFGEISGPHQHLAQARLRAVEQGLPVVRAANTGVSAVIDARGRIVAELGLGQQGFLDAALPAALPPTLYARTGDWPALATILFLALALAVPRRRKSD